MKNLLIGLILGCNSVTVGYLSYQQYQIETDYYEDGNAYEDTYGDGVPLYDSSPYGSWLNHNGEWYYKVPTYRYYNLRKYKLGIDEDTPAPPPIEDGEEAPPPPPA